MKLWNSKTTPGLKIIIVGCGKVGVALTEQLSKEGHEITLIDKNATRVQETANIYDVMGIIGNGASYNVQLEAGIETADLIIAVTSSDELNVLCCTIAKQAGDCAAIARICSPDYSQDISYLREKLGLTMIINPDLETAREIARILFLPTALEVNSFAHGQAEMVKFELPENNMLANMSISDLGKNISSDILICAVEREGEVHIPNGSFVLQEHDTISFVASPHTIRQFLKRIGFKTKQVKDTLIVGGGKSAYYLAKQLIAMGIDVRIIEQNADRCAELSILLPEAIIINADGTEQEVLREEGLEHVESFVPITGIDEENVMLTLYAKHVSDAKVITKINRMNFKNVIGDLNLGSVIYPRNAFDALTHSSFQVASIITTTGFSTVDFNTWSQTCKTVLVLLMFIGACAGSTGGGIKVSRFVILVKTVTKELGSYIHPKSIKKIKMDKKPVEHEVVRSVNVYLITFVILFCTSVFLISFEGKDLITNFTAVAATINNIGPGLELVGPTQNFASFTVFSKLVLMFDMLAGRLELFPLLILFHPTLIRSFFRRKK